MRKMMMETALKLEQVEHSPSPSQISIFSTSDL